MIRETVVHKEGTFPRLDFQKPPSRLRRRDKEISLLLFLQEIVFIQGIKVKYSHSQETSAANTPYKMSAFTYTVAWLVLIERKNMTGTRTSIMQLFGAWYLIMKWPKKKNLRVLTGASGCWGSTRRSTWSSSCMKPLRSVDTAPKPWNETD